MLALAGAALLGYAWYDSRLPSSFNAMDYGVMEYGGGPPQNHARRPHLRVDRLEGPSNGAPDFRTTLTAQKAKIGLGFGRTLEAWTFGGHVPGPELRVRQATSRRSRWSTRTSTTA